MAMLKQNAGAGLSLFETIDEPMPPKGTFVATIIDIRDRFGVERRKYQSEETEKVDVTQFLFGFRDRADAKFRLTSRVMRISGNENSNLFGFLKSLLGEAPRMGWDYVELKGRKVLLTVEHVEKRSAPGEFFAAIAAISPLPEGYGQTANHEATKVTKEDPNGFQNGGIPPPPPAPAPVEDDEEELPF